MEMMDVEMKGKFCLGFMFLRSSCEDIPIFRTTTLLHEGGNAGKFESWGLGRDSWGIPGGW